MFYAHADVRPKKKENGDAVMSLGRCLLPWLAAFFTFMSFLSFCGRW